MKKQNKKNKMSFSVISQFLLLGDQIFQFFDNLAPKARTPKTLQT